MPPNGHALLSASSSSRWLNCPPSARLCENYDDKGSDFAAEGTDAHTLCEYHLRRALGEDVNDPVENLTWYNSEMEDCATGYASFVMERVEARKAENSSPVVLVEQYVAGNLSREELEENAVYIINSLNKSKTVEEMLEIARMYSSEIEYSDENVYFILDKLLDFNDGLC